VAVVAKEEEVAGTASSRFPILSALALRDFRLLFIGQGISFVGDQFYFIALAWLTLQLTGSAVALGGVLTAAAVPRGLLMLGGGAISDRFSPRFLMLGSDAVRGVVVGVLAGLVLAGDAQLWMLYVLAVIFGTVDAVFYPAVGAMIPMLVDEGRRTSASALDQATQQGSSFIGPVLAGVLIAGAGRIEGNGIAFAFDAISFGLSTVALLLIRGGMRGQPSPPATGAEGTDSGEEAAEEGFFGSIRAGLRYAWSDPVLRPLLITAAGINVTTNGVLGVGLPLLARYHFAGGAAALGAMESAFGAGALVGIIVAGSMTLTRRLGLVVVAVTAGFGVACLILPFLPSLPPALIIIVVAAIGGGVINVLIMPWLQNRTDPAMFGRVSSILMLAAIGLTPVSYAAAGWISTISLDALFVSGAILILATAAFSLSSRTIRTM